MATVNVDQAKLVLNTFAAIFQNNLLSKDVVTWKKFDGEMNDRNGLEVVEQIVPDYTTTFTTDGVADLTSGVQDTTFGSERYKLDQTINSSMGWGDFVKIRDLDSARESEALKAAALRLATDIDSYILGFAAKASNNWIGDGSTDVDSWTELAQAYARLKAEGVDDFDTTAILDYDDWVALGSTVIADNASLASEGGGTFREGFSGKVAGIKTRFTQQLPTLTCGSRVASGTTLTNAPSASTYSDVAESPAAGQYKTQTINLDGQSGSVTLKDGEIFTIAGVYAYDNRAKKRLEHLQQFRVIGDYTASSGAFANVRVYPAIIASGPHQTVDYTGSLDGLAVTHLGAANAVLRPRFIANKSAIVVNTADLIMPATGEGTRKSLTKVPLSVRMWKHSDFNTGAHSIRFDVALKANISADGRRRLVRVNGA
jgi:hypothetical protein